MQLPFTADEFFDVFRAYNVAVWPAPVVLTLLALAAVFVVLRPRTGSDAFASGVLAALWIWLAFAYHLRFFSAINPLAYAFAGLSALGGGLFLWLGVVRRRPRFRASRSSRGIVGFVLIGYALIAYPLISIASGHSYPAMPTFGLPDDDLHDRRADVPRSAVPAKRRHRPSAVVAGRRPGGVPARRVAGPRARRDGHRRNLADAASYFLSDTSTTSRLTSPRTIAQRACLGDNA